jgi:hypothetical protein
VIAGMQRSSTHNGCDRVWLATARNLNDLKDFISLTDTPRRFDCVIAAAISRITPIASLCARASPPALVYLAINQEGY